MPNKKLIGSKLLVEFADLRTAKAVHVALLPDNHDFPKGMNFRQSLKGKKLEILISIRGQNSSSPAGGSIRTLTSTLDEIVAHIYSVTQTLEKVRQV